MKRKINRRGLPNKDSSPLGVRSSAAQLLLGRVSNEDHDLLDPLRREIDAISYSGSGGKIEKAKAKLSKLRTELNDPLSFEIMDAMLGDLESMHGRWTGDREEVQRGLKRILGLVLYLRTKHDLEHDDIWKLALAQAENWLGNAATRLAYLTRQHQDQRIAVMELEGALSAAPMDEFLHAVAGRNLGDALLGAMCWGHRVGPRFRSIVVLRNAAKEFRRLRRQETDADRKDHLNVERCAALSSLAVACMFVVEGLRLTLKSQYLSDGELLKFVKDEGRGDEDKLVEELAEECDRSIWFVFEAHRLARKGGKRWFRDARSLSNVGFAATFLLRYLMRSDNASADDIDRVRRIAEEAFEYSCTIYSDQEHPFRYAVTCDGHADLYRDLMLICADAKQRLVYADEANSRYRKTAAILRGIRGREAYIRWCECKAKIAFVDEHACEPNLTTPFDLWHDYVKWSNDKNEEEEKIAEKLGREFAKAISDVEGKLAARKARRRAFQEDDIKDIQGIVNFGKLNLPKDESARRLFATVVTRALKEARLVLSVDGQVALSLGVQKGSLLCIPRGGGSIGFLSKTVRVVPDPQFDESVEP